MSYGEECAICGAPSELWPPVIRSFGTSGEMSGTVWLMLPADAVLDLHREIRAGCYLNWEIIQIVCPCSTRLGERCGLQYSELEHKYWEISTHYRFHTNGYLIAWSFWVLEVRNKTFICWISQTKIIWAYARSNNDGFIFFINLYHFNACFFVSLKNSRLELNQLNS